MGAALLALILYGLSVGCSERDLETARSMAAAAGVARDSRGGYEEI